jgi:hypothetical protein
MSIEDTEGYDEFVKEVLNTLGREYVLAHYRFPPELLVAYFPPEVLLADIPAEQRLAGLDRDQVVLALSPELLRAIPETYLASLSPDTQAEVRRRLQSTGD